MTENEAIKILKRDLKIQQDNKTLIDGIEALQVAIKALEEKTMLNEIMHELSEYQAIGTVEDIQEVMALCKSLQETVCRYMNIGTIEEFKALKEKNTPMELSEHNFQDEVHHYLCPSCRSIVNCNQNYCEECGQALET